MAGLSLGASLQIVDVIGEILQQAVGMLNANGGFLFLKDANTRRFNLEKDTNLSEIQRQLLTASPMRGKLRRVVQTDAPLYLGPDALPAELESQFDGVGEALEAITILVA